MSDRLRVVALGGGTGLPVVLRGLSGVLGSSLDADPERLTGIVTVTDDGGSSGRLRRGRGVFPPGDVRNCLVALARDPYSLSEVFQYRYRGEHDTVDGLGGHSLGNLILAALAEQTGCPLEAIERAGRVLGVRGRLLPSTLTDVSLVADMSDGGVVRGETAIAADPRPVARIRLEPEQPLPTPAVQEAIDRADLIVFAPGSLFTSLMPILQLAGVSDAIRRAPGLRVLVGNLMTQPGETDGFGAGEHLEALEAHLGRGVLDAVLVAEDRPAPDVLARYARDGQVPVSWDEETLERHAVSLTRRRLLADGPKLRHDPTRLADGLLALVAGRSTREVGVLAPR